MIFLGCACWNGNNYCYIRGYGESEKITPGDHLLYTAVAYGLSMRVVWLCPTGRRE